MAGSGIVKKSALPDSRLRIVNDSQIPPRHTAFGEWRSDFLVCARHWRFVAGPIGDHNTRQLQRIDITFRIAMPCARILNEARCRHQSTIPAGTNPLVLIASESINLDFPPFGGFPAIRDDLPIGVEPCVILLLIEVELQPLPVTNNCHSIAKVFYREALVSMGIVAMIGVADPIEINLKRPHPEHRR